MNLLLTGQKIEREDLKPGDHIYAWRTLNIYAHHGIYIGDDEVIHFTEPNGKKSFGSIVESISPSMYCPKCGGPQKRTYNGVTVSCLTCFLDGCELNRYEYSVSWQQFHNCRNGTCSIAESDPPEIVIKRATSCIEEGFGVYNVVLNNCEDFAFYCKTGNVKGGKKSQSQNCIYIGDDEVIHFTEPNGQKSVAGFVVESISPSMQCPKCGGLKKKRTYNGVTVSFLDCFLDGCELNRYEYSVSWQLFRKSRRGICSVAESDPPEIVVKHATLCIEEGFGEYNFTRNNCEDFSFYCKTGNVKGGKRGQADCKIL